MVVIVDDGWTMNLHHCETAGSEVPMLDASSVTHLTCAEEMADHLERSLVLIIGVSDHTVAHHRGGKMQLETEVCWLGCQISRLP